MNEQPRKRPVVGNYIAHRHHELKGETATPENLVSTRSDLPQEAEKQGEGMGWNAGRAVKTGGERGKSNGERTGVSERSSEVRAVW